jgi:hypothetical protein
MFAKIAAALMALAFVAGPAAAADTAQTIIAMERAALDRWEHGDPSGMLEIAAPDVVYFDPFQAKRLDGLAALTAYYEPIRGKIDSARYELIAPKVQLAGGAAVLTFNFVSWDNAGMTHRWNCTEVYRHDPAGWRIIQTHWSFTTPGQP